MKLFSGWRADEARENRAQATRKPKIRWEVLGLPNPLDNSLESFNGRYPSGGNKRGKPWVRPGYPFTRH